MEIQTNDAIWFTEYSGHKFIHNLLDDTVLMDGKQIMFWSDGEWYLIDGESIGWMSFEDALIVYCGMNDIN